MKVDGSCHCGAITYEAEIDPAMVTICHCTDCQVMSGGPYRNNAPCKWENFNLTSGTPSLYLKSADSGNKRNQAFCCNCGAGIYSASEGDKPDMYILRVGAIRQRDQLAPKKQIWCDSEAPWLGQLKDTPRFPQQPSCAARNTR